MKFMNFLVVASGLSGLWGGLGYFMFGPVGATIGIVLAVSTAANLALHSDEHGFRE